MSPERRARFEALLTAAQREAVAQFCRDYGVPADQWPALPALRQLVEHAGWRRRSEQRRIGDGVTTAESQVLAADELGLKLDTLRERRHRAVARTFCPEMAHLEN